MARGCMEASCFTPCHVHGGAAQARAGSAAKVTPQVWSRAARTTWGRENKCRMDTEVRPQEDKLMAGWEHTVMGERGNSRQWGDRDGSKLDGKTKAQ